MRTPVPIPVQATFVNPPDDDEDRIDTVFDDAPDDDDEGFAGADDENENENENENEDDSDTRESASDDAPWSPVPLRPARDLVKRDPQSAIDVVFPTVYEEDRTAKLKDLITAQAAGIITHQRMSEQAAKELGFETYNYSEELSQILAEMKKLPPSLLGAADAIAGATKGGGGSGGGGISIGAPAAGITAERRGDLSGTSKHDFRRDQRSMVSTTDETSELSESRPVLALVTALREAALLRAKPDANTLAERAALREALAATQAIAASLMRLMEASARQPAPAIPPPADVSVTSPVEVTPAPINITMPEQPAPVVNVTITPVGKTRKTIERDEHGRAAAVVEEPVVESQ